MARAGFFGSAHVPAAGGGGVTFQTVLADTANTGSFSFPSVAIGLPSASRRVVVALAYRGGGPAATVTIGGVTASLDAGGAGASTSAEIWSAVVPSGTTATVEITFTSAGSGVGVGVWTVEGSPVASAVMSPTDQATVNMTLSTVAGDACVAVVSSRATTTAPGMVWNTATSRYDTAWDGAVRTHGGADRVASGASTDMGGVIGNFAVDSRAAAAAYR